MVPWESFLKEKKRHFISIANPAKIKSEKIGSTIPALKSKITISIDQKPNPQEEDLQTFAESFRHALLTQIEGFACTHLKIRYRKETDKRASALLHKYGFLDGMVEPIREVVHNLQQVIFQLNDGLEATEIKTVVQGTPSPSVQILKARDLIPKAGDGIAVLNPEHVIGHLKTGKMETELTLHLTRGTGYQPAAKVPSPGYDPKPDKPLEDVLLLPLDADFNPVKRVSWKLDPKNSALIFVIKTKGNVTPEEAYQQAWNHLKKS